jgi:Zn-finger nucleic acid-binding protein
MAMSAMGVGAERVTHLVVSHGGGFASLWMSPERRAGRRAYVKCPKCSSPLIVLELHEVEVDHCMSCGGVWLDAGELELLLDDASNRDALMETLSHDVGGKEKKIRCPICSKKLDKVLYGTEQKVRLDKCPRNDGLWFDNGELHDVITMGHFPSDNRVYEIINDIFGKSRK